VLNSALLFSGSGCGKGSADPYDRQAVRGAVTLDGQPLATGFITFYPDASGPVISTAPIHEGSFNIPQAQGLTVGKYKVSNMSTQPADEAQFMDPDELHANPPDPKSLIPKQYNTETKLVAEIEKSPNNTFVFDLLSE
jgi:hypothetical protein